MGDNTFVLAADGWAHITPCGEFPHAGAGVVQVIDLTACDAMEADFNARKADANFPGVLVDFDHFSLDTGQSSEAAGWITELESRDTGLWARVRWSDAGLAAVQGGRFRLMSPVFPPPSQCEDLGGGHIRPRALVSVALTNEPNIKGGRPLANRQAAETLNSQRSTLNSQREKPGGATANGANDANGIIESRGGTKKLMWVLGNPPSGKHCDTCLARAGKIKTAVEWARMKPPPCNCHCSLEPVDEATANRWSDMARVASLTVRRAKAAQRKAQERRERSQRSDDGGQKTAAGPDVVSRGGAETQRVETAREAVLRDLARARSARR